MSKILLLSVLVLVSCSVPHMQIDEDFHPEADRYPVSGRDGWLINQKLGFGEYQSGKVNRSWTKGYDLPFIIRFTGAKEKLQFTLRDGNKREADVFCLGKLRERDLTLFHQYFDLNLKTRDGFTGTIVLSPAKSYDFYVSNLNQNNWFKEAKGQLKGKDFQLDIRPVNRLDSGRKSLDWQVPGFEFVMNQNVVGAVEMLNNGEVWIRTDLNADQKLIIASLASALLLRSELSDHNEDI